MARIDFSNDILTLAPGGNDGAGNDGAGNEGTGEEGGTSNEDNLGEVESSTEQQESPPSVSSLSWDIAIIVVAAFIFLKWFKKKMGD